MPKKPKKPIVNYRSGPKKGLPKNCECGGEMDYAFSFSRVWSVCKKCSPVVKIDISKLKPKAQT